MAMLRMGAWCLMNGFVLAAIHGMKWIMMNMNIARIVDRKLLGRSCRNVGSLEQKDKGGSGEVRMAGTITKIIIYSLLMVMSIMLSADFYIQGRRLWALIYGTISVLWLTNLILFIVSLVISEAMK